MLPGKKIKMYYDPRGNLIRTVNPDKSEQWVINGKPNTLDSVAVKNSWSFKNYAPTPWESYTYDSDDLAPRTNGTSYGHDFTPKSATVDALGRTVKTIDRLSQNASDDVVMKYQYDIRGNLLKVTDALNRPAFAYTYDLRPQPQKEEGEEEKKLPPISTWHIDSGAKQNISDVTGKAIELRDAKGAQVLSGYDTISRPINIWEKDKTGEATTLRQHLIYGDSAGLPTPKDNNYLGKLYQQYDEAGLQQINNYDFKGNITDKFRKVISDATLLSVFGGSTVDCYRVNWQGLNTSILDAHEHQTNSAYDALNRVTELIYPEDVSAPTAKRKVLLPAYNNAGALESVVLKDDIGGTPTTYVNHIAYNAKGQRILIAFGNDVMTRYAYDKNTFRLKRQRTETYMQTGWTFASGGNVKQDTAYTYDLIGNILATNEAVTGCGIGGSNNLLRHFVYDDLYRLLSATGRENAPLAVPIWDDSFRSTDNSSTTAYTQRYQYDKMGNIKQLKHEGANNFTRNFNYNIATNNQLHSVDIGMTNYAFSYDANGNQLTETANRKMEWDAADRMRSFYMEASGSITKYTQYLYDGSGNRVKKLTWVQGGNYDSSTYIDGIFEYRTDGTDEQNTLHVMDDKSRIATVRIGDDFGDITPAIKYNIEDHLGSSAIQLETSGANINKEEYYPFGETSFGSYAKKRYKYCGKERDDESGLYYYGARYYNAWCCRFVSVDPLRDKYTYYTPYQYAGNKPINFIDLDGLEEGVNELGLSAPRLMDSREAGFTELLSSGEITMTPFVGAANLIRKAEARYNGSKDYNRLTFKTGSFIDDYSGKKFEGIFIDVVKEPVNGSSKNSLFDALDAVSIGGAGQAAGLLTKLPGAAGTLLKEASITAKKLENLKMGKAFEESYFKQLVSEGWDVTRRVSIKAYNDSGESIRSVVDFVAKKDGVTKFIETKLRDTTPLTSAQKFINNAIEKGKAFFTGKNAEDAGFKIGEKATQKIERENKFNK